MSPAIDDIAKELEGLKGRLDAIRAEQPYGAPPADAGAASGDTFSPDFAQVIAANGSVTYDVQAHLHALGIDLDVSTVTTPPADQRVRWLRTTGAYVASLMANDFGTNDTLGMEVQNPDATARIAQLFVAAGKSANLSRIIAQVADSDSAINDFTILDSNGASGFLRLPDAQRTSCSWGLISSAGVKSAGSVGDYTVARTGAGAYTVTWTTAKAGAAYAILPAAFNTGSLLAVANVAGITANGFNVVTFVSTTGANVDTAWAFLTIDAQ